MAAARGAELINTLRARAAAIIELRETFGMRPGLIEGLLLVEIADEHGRARALWRRNDDAWRPPRHVLAAVDRWLAVRPADPPDPRVFRASLAQIEKILAERKGATR